MKKLYTILVCSLMLCLSVSVMAQSSGDKLFLEGQQLQQIQTIASQKSAIKKFQAAKVVYNTPDKKEMCDNQVVICNNNIKALRNKADNANTKKTAELPANNTKNEVKAPKQDTHVNVKLSLSESRLDFKYKPKEGATQSVEVTCNYQDWKISSTPEWITVYTAENKFTVEAAENSTAEERAGVIKVQCGDKIVDLVVNQEKEKPVDKLTGIFKKRKK